MLRIANNLSVAGRIYLLAALGAILMLAVAGLGLRNQASTLADLKEVYEERAEPLVQLARINRLLQENTKEIILAFQHDPGNPLSAIHDHPVGAHLERFEARRKEISEQWQHFAADHVDGGAKPLAEDFKAKRGDWLKHADTALQHLAANDFSAEVITRFIKAEREQGQAALAALDKLVAHETAEAKETYAEAQAGYERNVYLFLVIVAAGLALSIFITWGLIRSVIPPLRHAVAVAEGVSRGDLTQAIPQGGDNEIGRLMKAMAAMQVGLRDLVSANKHSAQALTEAAEGLAAASQQVAHAGQVQSEAASGMAASVEEMSVSIDHVRDNAREALDVAARSGEASRSGGQVIHASANEMRQIADAVNGSAATIRELEGYSEEISSIVNVIREIADQTNLLALNAAIEAARAGEQGRGFAVVADEVRKLAERTANSTQQISAMIGKVQAGAHRAATEMEQGVGRVTEGMNLAHQAGDSITGIQDNAHRVAGVVDEIVSALNEQALASQDIAKGVEHIAQMAEENNAAIRETADAARQVNGLAKELRETVTRFKV
ncbi:MAG TPA: methyl-accepting chemotaxis protein [Thiobacillaceae bacterium]|nr:methyl-accepting chemotaxis protein [Thiobacillaceae bacterium]